MKKVLITKENYKGYCKLYDYKRNISILVIFFQFIITFITIFLTFSFSNFVILYILNSVFIVPIIGEFLYKSNLKKLKKSYSIDININYKDLVNALKENGILKGNRLDIKRLDMVYYQEELNRIENFHDDLNKKYEENLKYINECEKVKKDIINQDKYKDISNGFIFSYENEKQKIKVLNRKLY